MTQDWTSTEVLRAEALRRLRELGLDQQAIESLPEDQAEILKEIFHTQESLAEALRVSGFDDYVPNAAQLRFHELETSCRGMFCANRVGKSKANRKEVKWFANGDHPYRDVGNRGPIWVCGETDEKLRNFIMPELEREIGSEHIRKKVLSPRPSWELTNDIPIYFKNYAQDAATFAGEHIRLISYDEPPPWDIFEEGWFRRGKGYDLDIIITATLVEGTDSWMYRKIMSEGEDRLPDTSYTTGSLFENPHIPEEQVKLLVKGIKGVMYKIRVLGEVLPIGDTSFFDVDILFDWLKHAQDPILKFNMNQGRLIQTDDGILHVWRLPERNHEYVIGFDPSEGLATSDTDEPEFDESAGAILDRHRREFVGEFVSGTIRPDQAGEWWLPTISAFYNNARTVVERNFHGNTVIEFARRKMASRLYRPKTDRTDIVQDTDRGYGHLTTQPSRRYMVDLLDRAIDETPAERERLRKGVKVYSRASIRQMASFVRKKNGRVEHRDGCKDDRVFAYGLALVGDADLSSPLPLPDTSEKAQLRQIGLRRREYDPGEWRRRLG